MWSSQSLQGVLQFNYTQCKKMVPFAYFLSLAPVFNSCSSYEGKICSLHYEGNEISFLHSCPLHLLSWIISFPAFLSFSWKGTIPFHCDSTVITFPWPFLLHFPFFKKHKHKLYTVLKMWYTTHLSNGLIIFYILFSFHFLTILIKLYAPLTTVEHLTDVLIAPATVISISLSWEAIANLQTIILYVQLRMCFSMCISLHILTLNFICCFTVQSFSIMKSSCNSLQSIWELNVSHKQQILSPCIYFFF